MAQSSFVSTFIVASATLYCLTLFFSIIRFDCDASITLCHSFSVVKGWLANAIQLNTEQMADDGGLFSFDVDCEVHCVQCGEGDRSADPFPTLNRWWMMVQCPFDVDCGAFESAKWSVHLLY